MKVKLNFVHRDDDMYDGKDDGPLQLIRPMPNIPVLRDYVTTEEYQHFCIQTIDPLQEAFYEAVKSYRRNMLCMIITVYVLALIVIQSAFYGLVAVSLVLICTFAISIFIRGCYLIYIYTGAEKRLQVAIRTECKKNDE